MTRIHARAALAATQEPERFDGDPGPLGDKETGVAGGFGA